MKSLNHQVFEQLSFGQISAIITSIKFMSQKCKSLGCILFSLLVFFCVSRPIYAVSTKSTHYDASQIEFGSGSSLETCSGQYCASTSIGSLSAGEQASPKHKVTFGDITSSGEPLLEVIVESGESDLGVLSVDKTATKTMLVKIRTYLSDGYTLSIVGSPPKYNNHYLATSDTPEDSVAGKEQFGINVVSNTTPAIGANPVQTPSSDISFGEVMDDYNVTNKFKYQDGDVIAKSLSESGQTEYTISTVVNIANNTPAGHYSGDFSAVVIPVF